MIKKLALAAGSIFICLLLAEIFVRLFALAPGVTRIQVDLLHGSFVSSTNPILRYVPRPGSHGISSYGIRDRHYDEEKPPNGVRIVTIGDSVGYGFCNDREVLSPDQVFAKQLERNLQQSSKSPVEVINLSVSGYDTVQEVEFLVEKGLALDPDVVLVQYCLNDNFDASLELRFLNRNPQFGIDGVIAQRLFLKSHLLRLIWLTGWAREKQPKRETVSRTEKGFRRLSELAKEYGFQPVIVVFPLLEPLEGYRWHQHHRQAARLAKKYGLPVLDLLDAFSEASSGDLKRLQGRCNREHPDETGHRVAALEIEQFLERNQVIRIIQR